MAIRVVISDSPPEGVRWQVVEGKVVLKTGTANSQPEECPSSNGLGQSELFRDGGSGSFGLEFRRLSTDVAIVAV